MTIRLVTTADLDTLSRDALANPRRRLNLNLHEQAADPCQRLFNAVEPGSYIRPHRHTDPPKNECFVAVRGRFVLLIFDDAGGVTEAVHLAPDGSEIAAEVPAGTWHSVLALEPGSIFFETKPGPYCPLSDKDFAPWAPAERAPEALWYLETLYEAVLNADD